MKKSRFTEAQIVAILKELDAGTAATELARRHGIHANTIRERNAVKILADVGNDSKAFRIYGPHRITCCTRATNRSEAAFAPIDGRR